MSGSKEQRAKNAQPKKVRMTADQLRTNEIGFAAEVIGFANSHVTSIYADSTVVKTPEVVFRGAVYGRDRFLSEEYLLNYRRNRADLSMPIGVNNYRLPNVVQSQACRRHIEDPERLVPLPEWENITAPISPVIRSRRSLRKYSGKPFELKDLATILYHAQGVTGYQELQGMPRTVTFSEDQRLHLRAAPSGGGLYPIHLYFFALAVKDLERGVYRYVPEHHALECIRKLEPGYDIHQLAQLGEMNADQANLLVVYVYELYANSRKYGDSGMAYAFIEAGEISAHLHLITTAMHFGACDIGGYNKAVLGQTIGLDGLTEHVIHFTIIGRP